MKVWTLTLGRERASSVAQFSSQERGLYKPTSNSLLAVKTDFSGLGKFEYVNEPLIAQI